MSVTHLQYSIDLCNVSLVLRVSSFAATEGSAAAPLSSATRLVVIVSLIASLVVSFGSCHYVMF